MNIKVLVAILLVAALCFIIIGVNMVSKRLVLNPPATQDDKNLFDWGHWKEKLIDENLIEKDMDEEKTETIDGIDNIDIDTSFADVNIIPMERNDIKVHSRGNIRSTAIPKLKVAKSQDTLNISLNADPIANIFNSNVVLDIYLPNTYSGNFRIETASGDINLSALDAEKLKIDTVSGDVHITDSYLESTSVESISGNHLIDKLNTAKGNFSSVSGDIEILNSSIDSISTESISGDQRVEDLVYSEGEFSAVSGDITLTFPKGSQFNLDATTTSGDIGSEFPMTIKSNSRFELQASVGESSNDISISTISGDISINTN